MPRVPGVPTLEPVNLPQMSPAQAGRSGEAIAGLGEVVNDTAQTGLALDMYIKRAQESVDTIAAQNQLTAAQLQYETNLAKTTKSRDIPDVAKAAQDHLNDIAKQWDKSPASVQIQQMADGLRPRVDHIGQVRGIDLMSKEGAVQSEIQLQTLLPQLVTAQRNGDKGQVDYINGYITHMYDDLTKRGLMSDADKDIALNKVQIQYRAQLNESYISSADPKERQASISQLKTGGSGPLNLAGLAPGDVAALRTQAEATNEHLNNLAEAGNLNRDLNVVKNAFSAPEYKNNYEARVNSLQDGEWLQKHGIVSEDGSPNRVMAEKLIAETNRERAEWEKEKDDHDASVLPKIEDAILANKVSRGQLVQIGQQEGLSPRGQSAMLREWDENQRYNHQISIQERELANQERAQKSADASSDWILRIAHGEIPNDADIMTTPGLSKSDRNSIISYRDKAKNDKPYQGGMTIIASAYPQNKKAPAALQGQQQEYYLRTMQAYDQEINAHPNEDKSAIATKLVMPGIVRDAIINSVNAVAYPTPPTDNVLTRFWKGLGNFNEGIATGSAVPDEAEPTSTSPPAAAPKVTRSATIVQHSPSTGKDRYSTDGGTTWLPGKPPSQ